MADIILIVMHDLKAYTGVDRRIIMDGLAFFCEMNQMKYKRLASIYFFHVNFIFVFKYIYIRIESLYNLKIRLVDRQQIVLL